MWLHRAVWFLPLAAAAATHLKGWRGSSDWSGSSDWRGSSDWMDWLAGETASPSTLPATPPRPAAQLNAHSLICWLTHSLAHSCVGSLTHPHLLTHLLAHLLTHSITHCWLTHSITCSPTCSLIHSLVCWLTGTPSPSRAVRATIS